MAVKQVGCTTAGEKKEYVCLSTDIKPTNCGAGSQCLELDTKTAYVYDGISQWYPV